MSQRRLGPAHRLCLLGQHLALLLWSQDVSCFLHSKSSLRPSFCDSCPNAVSSPEVCSTARGPAFPSLPSRLPGPSCGASGSSWHLTRLSRLAASLTPAHPPGGPCALGLGCASSGCTQRGSDVQPRPGLPSLFPCLMALAAHTGLSGSLAHSLHPLPGLLLCRESPPLPVSSRLFQEFEAPPSSSRAPMSPSLRCPLVSPKGTLWSLQLPFASKLYLAPTLTSSSNLLLR